MIGEMLKKQWGEREGFSRSEGCNIQTENLQPVPKHNGYKAPNTPPAHCHKMSKHQGYKENPKSKEKNLK
jgi:hypothetical protein